MGGVGGVRCVRVLCAGVVNAWWCGRLGGVTRVLV